jgi:hypothetical protein
MKDGEKAVWGCIGILAAVLTTLVVGSIWGGWVLAKLWGWFIVPLFGLSPLTFVQAIGVNLVVSAFVASSPTKESKNQSSTEAWFRIVGVTVFQPLTYLVMGWIVQSFM